MSRHSFAELLQVFWVLRLEPELNQADLAQKIGVSLPTLSNWFTGKYKPRRTEDVDTLARVLRLSAFEADLLLYAINPKWVKYQTPLHILDQFEFIKTWEKLMPQAPFIPCERVPIEQMETHWPLFFEDRFESNGNHWGLGWRDDGVCRVERSIANGCYTLTLHNRFYWNIYLGGDSHCFAPPVYYMSVEVQRLSGNNAEEDGFGLIFEEICDGSHGLFRIRDAVPAISIFLTRNGGDHCDIYLDRTSCAAVRVRQTNKLAILAINNHHWFYVNNVLVFDAEIPRIPHTRLDVGIFSGSTVPVTCEYRNFVVRVPTPIAQANGTPTL